jgi:hypothetical protein
MTINWGQKALFIGSRPKSAIHGEVFGKEVVPGYSYWGAGNNCNFPPRHRMLHWEETGSGHLLALPGLL